MFSCYVPVQVLILSGAHLPDLDNDMHRIKLKQYKLSEIVQSLKLSVTIHSKFSDAKGHILTLLSS